MKNKEKSQVKGKKVRRINGEPMSSLAAHPKKSKKMEVLKLRKNKKREYILSNSEKTLAIFKSEASKGVPIPEEVDDDALNQTSLPKESHGKKKKIEQKKSHKDALSDGLLISLKAAKEGVKQTKAKTSSKKHAIHDSLDSTSSEHSELQEEEIVTVPETDKISPQLFAEKKNVQSKKKKISVENDLLTTSPEAAMTNGSKLHQSPEDDSEETFPQSLSNNPLEEGKSLFQWLISPLSVEDFFKNNWERAPLHIKRSKSNYYKLLMSTPMLDTILRDHFILYTKNIDITSYSNGQRETHNPHGRARPSVVWDYYSNGCSIRMLNPQTFIPRLHTLNAMLQEFFGCFVGANSYLTPPDSQGFAPHYDDIEAFIIQIEGKKRWRLYKPSSEAEYLPRYSSKNFDPSEIGKPILDTVVSAGDMLYFPRGTIHQGETIDGTHSLHITLSVYQKNSWCDFLEKLLPDALNTAVRTDSQFREGLPIDYLRHVGLVHSQKNSEDRENFIQKTKQLLHRVIDHIDVDKIADQMAKVNVHDFLPPVLSPQEQECSILQDGERMTTPGLVENRVEIEPDTRIRLLRSHCIRLVEEEDTMKIYYSTENSAEYHEYEPQFLEVEKEMAPAIQEIIRCYPNFVRVDDLPIEGEDNKVQVARDLWEKCIVVTDVPLPIVE